MMRLPYNASCPVIYDNDAVIDVYTDEYIMALASAGEIRLVGMITSSSIAPFNKYVPAEDFENPTPPVANRLNMVNNRKHGVQSARESGFRTIPDPVIGMKGHLQRPSSNDINDTVPFKTAGSDLIIHEARKASPDVPLVLVMGGPLSVAANAYLLDASIADRTVIAWLGGSIIGMNDYNGGADPWAAYIVLKHMHLVQFPANYATPPNYLDCSPSVPKSRLHELPDTPLREWMIGKDCPTNELPDNRCADSMPVISIVCPDVIKEYKKVSFSHWNKNTGLEVPDGVIPYFKDDIGGNTILITQVDVELATEAWWKGMKNPKAWGA
jgi:hypothetical protein